MYYFELLPSNIRFSQDSIASTFGDYSDHAGVTIGETLDGIINGSCSVFDIPVIFVSQKNNQWYTADNRRLWVFRKAEELGYIKTITVKKGYVKPEKFTTTNDGQTVEVRGNAGGVIWKRLQKRQTKGIQVNNNRQRVNISSPDSALQGYGGNRFSTNKSFNKTNIDGNKTNLRDHKRIADDTTLKQNYNHERFQIKDGPPHGQDKYRSITQYPNMYGRRQSETAPPVSTDGITILTGRNISSHEYNSTTPNSNMSSSTSRELIPAETRQRNNERETRKSVCCCVIS